MVAICSAPSVQGTSRGCSWFDWFTSLWVDDGFVEFEDCSSCLLRRHFKLCQHTQQTKMAATADPTEIPILNLVEMPDAGTGQESDGTVSPTVQQTRSYKYTGIYRGAI